MTVPRWMPLTVGGAAGPPAQVALTTTFRASRSASVTTTAAAGRRSQKCRASDGANRPHPSATGPTNRKVTRARSSGAGERTRCRMCKRTPRVEGMGVSESLRPLRLDIPLCHWLKPRSLAIVTCTLSLMGDALLTTTRPSKDPVSLRGRWT